MATRNYDWSIPETNQPFVYQNRFGRVVLSPVTGFMPIDQIDRNRVPVIDDVLVSTDIAEKVTLITENRKAYMSFNFPFLNGNNEFALQYSCRNRACVCRITELHFVSEDGRTAQEQIESMATSIIGPLPVN